jgi:hypothetical protein
MGEGKSWSLQERKKSQNNQLNQFEPTRRSEAEGMEGSCNEEQCM